MAKVERICHLDELCDVCDTMSSMLLEGKKVSKNRRILAIKARHFIRMCKKTKCSYIKNHTNFSLIDLLTKENTTVEKIIDAYIKSIDGCDVPCICKKCGHISRGDANTENEDCVKCKSQMVYSALVLSHFI